MGWTLSPPGLMLNRMDVESYLKVCNQFRLGELVTEKPHPDTVGLAERARSDLHGALATFHHVDKLALEGLTDSLGPMGEMVAAMHSTLSAGGRIFLAGCGATGRLALSLETFAREAWLPENTAGRVIAFMAGGDAALIRSIESFEDYPEYGQRQLNELGFTEEDLLIAITEGGETPWVIGACQEAARRSKQRPWFLFCNPPEQLRALTQRSREILTNDRVRPFFLNIGPMALAGSTRLQATTAQMLVTGAALAEALGHGSANDTIKQFRTRLISQPYEFLAPFIEAEAQVYLDGNHVLYQTDRYGMTVLTDTTERSPTFSLAPFENRNCGNEPASWCYLSLSGQKDSAHAWKALLGRPMRTLDWEDFRTRASTEALLGYDISEQVVDWRNRRNPETKQFPYLVYGDDVRMEFAGHSASLGLQGTSILIRNLMLKCCLNAQSTLVMGRLGLFESNLMTKVRPSNYKLIDRAARHAQFHHEQKTGAHMAYEEAVRQVFDSLK